MNECVRQRGLRSEGASRRPLNRWIAGEVRARGGGRHGRHRGLQVQRGGERRLRVRLGHVLRLVSGAGQAAPDRQRRGGEGRDARHHGLGARPDPEAAAPVHAVHHRGAVGATGRGRRRAREPAVPRRLAGASRARRCGGRRGDRLAGQADQRGALGALGDERAGRRQDPAGAGRRAARPTRARAERHEETIKRLARLDDASRSPRRAPKGSAQIVLGETTAALPLAGIIDMDAERKRLDARDRQVRRPRSARSTPSSPTRASSPRRRPRWWRRTASAAPTSRRPEEAAGRAEAGRGGGLSPTSSFPPGAAPSGISSLQALPRC